MVTRYRFPSPPSDLGLLAPYIKRMKGGSGASPCCASSRALLGDGDALRVYTAQGLTSKWVSLWDRPAGTSCLPPTPLRLEEGAPTVADRRRNVIRFTASRMSLRIASKALSVLL